MGYRAAGHPRVGLACLARCHARLRLKLTLVSGSAGFVSRPHNVVTACNNSRLSVALARPRLRLDKASLGSSTYCVIAS